MKTLPNTEEAHQIIRRGDGWERLYAACPTLNDPGVDSEDPMASYDYPVAREIATLISSECSDGLHRVAIDCDDGTAVLEASLLFGEDMVRVESTTPGHFHVYGTKGYRWEQFEQLLKLFQSLGIIGNQYLDYCLTRKWSSLRIPGTFKKTGKELPE